MKDEKISIEEAQILADYITELVPTLKKIDLDFLLKCANEIQQEANNYDTLAVLDPGYDRSVSDLKRKKAEALFDLAKYITTLKKIDELTLKVEANKFSRSELLRQFGL